MRYFYRPGHPKASPNGFVSELDDPGPFVEPKTYAINAGIMVGRFYENARTTEGVDIGSRAKHRNYMKEHGLSMFSDYAPDYYERQRKARWLQTKKDRRAVLERKMWEIDKP